MMQYPFSDLLQGTKQYPYRESKYVDPVTLTNSFYRDSFKAQLANINTLNDNEIIKGITNNIDDIVSDIDYYKKYFMNMKFLTNFIRVVYSRPITTLIKVACNHIIYDYFTSENNDTKIKIEMMRLADAVNNQEIKLLKAKGISDTLAKNLTIARYSSMNERINAERLNFVICSQEPEIMSIQLIVYIYEILFDHLTDLFLGIIFETYSLQDRENLGEDFFELYSSITCAILIILNNMALEQIYRIIKIYANEWIDRNYPPIRFSLRSLSNDYGRILQVVEVLLTEGISVP